MDLFVCKMAFSFTSFIGAVISAFLPFCFMQCCRERRRPRLRRKSSDEDHRPLVPDPPPPACIGLGQSFAAGIFIAVCFFSLMPAIRHHLTYDEVSRAADGIPGGSSDVSRYSSLTMNRMSVWKKVPWPEALVLAGFFLAMLVVESTCVTEACARRHYRSASRKQQRVLASKKKRLNNNESKPLISVEPKEGAADSSADEEKEEFRTELMSAEDPKEQKRGLSVVECTAEETASNAEVSLGVALLLFCLMTEALFDGVAIGVQESVDVLKHVFSGIICRQMLCAIAFGLRLGDCRLKVFSAFLLVVIFGLSVPLGMVIGCLSQNQPRFNVEFVVSLTLLKALAAGMLLYVAQMQVLSREMQQRKRRFGKALVTLTSCALFFVFLLLLA